MQKVTIFDVARKAGVSPATVSRVLNNNTKNHMREETKQKVLKAIKELNYTPNKYAQFMKKQKSGVIGVVVPDISNQFFSLMVRGIENISYQNDYSVIICDTENSIEKELKYMNVLIFKERVEGIILVPSNIENSQVKKFIKKKIPVVLADRKLKNLNVPYVGSDGFRDSYMLTEYLISLGYQKIGFVKGHHQLTTAQERFEGYVTAMNHYRLPVEKNYIKEGGYTFESGYKAGKEIINSNKELPQAIIAANDLMAVGVMRALEEEGIKIPQDIGVAGFDHIPLSSLVSPRLTTVEISAYTIGQEATLMLLDYIKKRRKQKKTLMLLDYIKKRRKQKKVKILDSKLIKGESCRCVRQAKVNMNLASG